MMVYKFQRQNRQSGLFQYRTYTQTTQRAAECCQFFNFGHFGGVQRIGLYLSKSCCSEDMNDFEIIVKTFKFDSSFKQDCEALMGR